MNEKQKNNPFYPHRTQSDGLGDAESARTATINDEESLTRQEFKNEADINWILARHGVNTQVRADPQYTETDYGMDLQQAYLATEIASSIQAPEELRKQFPDWLAIMHGVHDGSYMKALADLETQKKTEAEAAKVQKTDTPSA